MAEKNPLVSIIIPAYNAERFIERSVKSALAQTYQDIEIIVVDDGSTDNTAKIVHSFDDPRVRYFHQEKKCQGAARNYGIKQSKGDYITFLDADDAYLPEKVEKQVNFLKQNPQYQICYCDVAHFYSNNPDKFFRRRSDHPSGDIFQSLLHGSLINPNAAMLVRAVFDKSGLFGETSRYWPEEWDLWLRIARAGFQFGYIDERLVKVEIHEGSNTTMEIQPILKKYALEMCEKLFSQMPADDKKKYGAEEILSGLKFKLAVAYLLNNKFKDFFSTAAGVNSFTWRFFLNIFGAVMFATPRSLNKKLLTWLWLKYQSRGLVEVSL